MLHLNLRENRAGPPFYCHFQGKDPFPRSVVRELWERYPEAKNAFRKGRIFVIEFQAGSVDFDEPLSVEEAESRAQAAYDACAPARLAVLLFLAHARPDAARRLATRPPRVPAGTFLGACGYVEGGIDFWGADGTIIKSDDWDGARTYALKISAMALA